MLQKIHNNGIYERGTDVNWKTFKWPTLEKFQQQKKVVLDYDPKYKNKIFMSP